MNVTKEIVIPAISVVFGSLLDLFLRTTPVNSLSFLTAPLFSLNLIEVALVIFVVVMGYRLIPRNCKRLINRSRAKRFQSNWEQFKALLARYQATNENLQSKYGVLRVRTREDVNYFLTDIAEVLAQTGRQHENQAFNNFMQCLMPEKIEDWQGKVQRRIPEELDCFDYIPASLVRRFDKLWSAERE